MDVRFVAGFAVITTDPALDKGLFMETLGLPLRPPVSVPNSEYVYSEDVAGAKHFAVSETEESEPARHDGQVRRLEDGSVTALRRLVPVLTLAVCLTACTGDEASDDGTALLRNETGRKDLRVFVLDGSGRPLMDAALDPAFRFDTQFTDRERQCLVAGDGSFEVRDADGAVLVEHDFADRPVCEHDELEVTDDLELVWDD